MTIRSSLARLQPAAATPPHVIENMIHDMWHADRRFALIDLQRVTDPWLRQHVVNYMTEHHPERTKR